MNLQQTIDELEAKAAQYTEAASTLRALLEREQSGETEAVVEAAAPAKKRAAKKSGRGAAKKKTDGRRAPVSEETRAKISAAIRARHAEKKAQAA